MNAQIIIRDPSLYKTIPIIDGEFDRFEWNHALERQMREAENDNEYHDSMNDEA